MALTHDCRTSACRKYLMKEYFAWGRMPSVPHVSDAWWLMILYLSTCVCWGFLSEWWSIPPHGTHPATFPLIIRGFWLPPTLCLHNQQTSPAGHRLRCYHCQSITGINYRQRNAHCEDLMIYFNGHWLRILTFCSEVTLKPVILTALPFKIVSYTSFSIFLNELKHWFKWRKNWLSITIFQNTMVTG